MTSSNTTGFFWSTRVLTSGGEETMPLLSLLRPAFTPCVPTSRITMWTWTWTRETMSQTLLLPTFSTWVFLSGCIRKGKWSVPFGEVTTLDDIGHDPNFQDQRHPAEMSSTRTSGGPETLPGEPHQSNVDCILVTWCYESKWKDNAVHHREDTCRGSKSQQVPFSEKSPVW